MEKNKKARDEVSTTTTTKTTTPQLCNELIERILILLPTKTLFKCISVSKTFQSIITSPSFIKTRKSLQLPPLTSGFFFCKHEEFYALYNPHLHYCEIASNDTQIDTQFAFLGVPVFPIASHNGLLLCAEKPDDIRKFSRYHQYRYILCNPCTKQYVVLPKSNCFHHLRNIVLYTCEDGNQETDFVIVSVKDESCENVLELVVYSSESGEWKELKILHNHGIIRASSMNVLFRESVYFWSKENKHLCVYNLRQETVGVLKLPVCVGSVVNLGVLADSLCYSETNGMHIWVSVLDEDEWLLKYLIRFDNLVDNHDWNCFHPLAFHPLHGQMVLVHLVHWSHADKVGLYDARTNRVDVVYDIGSSYYFPEIPYFCPAWPPSIRKHQKYAEAPLKLAGSPDNAEEPGSKSSKRMKVTSSSLIPSRLNLH